MIDAFIEIGSVLQQRIFGLKIYSENWVDGKTVEDP